MPRFGLRGVSLCRGLLYLTVGLAICEFIVVNITLLYAYHTFSRHIDKIYQLFTDQSPNDRSTFIDKLIQLPAIKSLLYSGKSGGFVNLLQNSIERVFIVSGSGNATNLLSGVAASPHFGEQQISFLGLDVSSAGEVLFLLRRMQGRGDDFFKQYRRLVIDIGANDGLMASNSFNLIQLGWDAILVEPQMSLLRQAKDNIARYSDPYNEGTQMVTLVNAMMGANDGMEDFVIMDSDQESHLLDHNRARRESRFDPTKHLVIKVQSLTVRTFASKYEVPKKFAVLSVDAEGVGDKILHQWIDEGFRPAYIVYEQLHNKEPIKVTSDLLFKSGYSYLAKLGWNYIFEHVDS